MPDEIHWVELLRVYDRFEAEITRKRLGPQFGWALVVLVVAYAVATLMKW